MMGAFHLWSWTSIREDLTIVPRYDSRARAGFLMPGDGYIYIHMASFHFYYILWNCGYITSEDQEE